MIKFNLDFLGEESCTLCPAGSYQNEPRQGVCKTCPAGTWTVEEGSKSEADCIPVCGHGTYSPSGLVPCLECPKNSYTGEPPFDGFKECIGCPDDLFTFQPGKGPPINDVSLEGEGGG